MNEAPEGQEKDPKRSVVEERKHGDTDHGPDFFLSYSHDEPGIVFCGPTAIFRRLSTGPGYVREAPLRKLSAQWAASHFPGKQIQSILEHAEDVFGDAVIAEKWLQEANLATDCQPPITLLGSEEGYARVKTLLDRIDYGVLA